MRIRSDNCHTGIIRSGIQPTGMKKVDILLRSVLLALCLAVGGSHPEIAMAQSNLTTRPADPNQSLERTSFQTGARWDPKLQLRSDVAMCYGVGPDIGKRVAQWRAQGYRVHVMTGVAWGEYQDYLYGRFDGI